MLQDGILQSGCTPEWVAKTYGEYLASKADNYTSLITAINNSISLDFDEEIEEVDELYDGVMKQLSDTIIDLAEDQNIALKELDSTSNQYQQFLESAKTDPQILEILNSNFDDVADILQNFGSYLFPNVAIELNVPEIDASVVGLTNVGLPDLREKFLSYKTLLEEKANQVMEETNLPNCTISSEGGYTSLKNLLYSVLSNSNLTESSDAKLNLSLTDINGVPISSANQTGIGYSLNSLTLEMQNTYNSAVQYAAGFLASTKESVADRIIYYNAYIQDRIQGAALLVTNTTKQIKDKLSDAKSTCVDFFDSFMHLTGWDQFNIEEQTGATNVLGSTDMSQYTGSSPVAALDFSTAKQAISSTAKTVAYAVASVAKTLWNLGKRLFSKVKSKFIQLTSDPYDIEEVDNAANSGLVDGFQYQLYHHALPIAQEPMGFTRSQVESALNPHLNGWICQQSLFTENLTRFSDLQFNSNIINEWYATVKVDRVIKPKSISIEKFISAVEYADSLATIKHVHIRPDHNTFTFWSDRKANESWAEFISWYQSLSNRLNQMGDIYNSTDVSEDYFVKGFILSMQMQVTYEAASANYLASQQDGDYMYFSNYTPSLMGLVNIDLNHTSVTNLDFVKACSGYDPDGTFATLPITLLDPSRSADVRLDDISTSASLAPSGILFASWIDKVLHPLDYLYLPYSNNKTNFSDPQWRIKTDDQNSDAFSKFLNAAIIIIIVAIIAVSAVVVARKISRARYFRKASKVAQMDNALRQGIKLTSRQQRKYVRLRNKMIKSGLFISATTGSSNSSVYDNINSVGSKLDTVYCQVTGESSSPLSQYLPSKDASDENISELKRILYAIRPEN